MRRRAARWALATLLAGGMGLYGCAPEAGTGPTSEAGGAVHEAAGRATDRRAAENEGRPTKLNLRPVSASRSAVEAERANGGQIVRIDGGDDLQFTPRKIRVDSGKPIRIRFENTGTKPKKAAGHNLVVLTKGADAGRFAAKALQAAPDFVPKGPAASKAVVASTPLLGPGETATIEIDGLAPGRYRFLCTFPGHAVTMNGVLLAD